MARVETPRTRYKRLKEEGKDVYGNPILRPPPRPPPVCAHLRCAGYRPAASRLPFTPQIKCEPTMRAPTRDSGATTASSAGVRPSSACGISPRCNCPSPPPQSSAKQPCELSLLIQVDQSVEFIRSALAAKGGYFYRSTPEDVAYAMV